MDNKVEWIYRWKEPLKHGALYLILHAVKINAIDAEISFAFMNVYVT